MKQESRKSLREFSLTKTTTKGDTFVIHYGYDLCTGSNAFYVEASINGSPFSASKKTLTRVQKLEIKPISDLIDLIGLDETGSMEDIQLHTQESIVALLSGDKSKHGDLLQLFQISSIQELDKLDTMISNVSVAMKTTGSIAHIINRYVKTRRLAMLSHVAEVMVSLRGLKSLSVTRGYLAKHGYPTYTKRDADYIRKSRVRIFSKILKREYKPAT